MFIQFTLISIIPYAFSTWLIWQDSKNGTFLPTGRIPRKFGRLIAYLIRIPYFTILIFICFNYGWIHIISFPITWFIGNWVATYFERKIFMNQVLYDVEVIISMYPNANGDQIRHIINIPKWWFNLMPTNWQNDYFLIINSHCEDI